MRLHAEGDLDAARRMLQAAASSFKHGPWRSGEVWNNFYGGYLQAKTRLDTPCEIRLGESNFRRGVQWEN